MRVTVHEYVGRVSIDVKELGLQAGTWVGLDVDGDYVKADGLIIKPLLVLGEPSAGRGDVAAARLIVASLWDDTPPIGYEYWLGSYKVGQVVRKGMVIFEVMEKAEGCCSHCLGPESPPPPVPKHRGKRAAD